MTIHIQDVTQAYPGLAFPGLTDYAGRGMACRGRVAVVPRGDHELHRYYQGIGIGVDEVMEVPFHPELGVYATLLEEPYRSQLLAVVAEGHRIQFFNTREGVEEAFVRALGLSWDDCVVSWPSNIADMANDKAKLRRIGQHIGANWVFPSYVLVSGPDYKGLYDAVQELGGFGKAVVKLNNSATSQGTLVPWSEDELQQWFWQFRDRIDVVVVDKFIKDHTTITTAARVVGGVIEDRWYSQQDMNHDGNTFDHKHSVVGECNRISEADALRMRRMCMPFDNYFLEQNPGASGIANYDFVKDNETGEIMMVEANFRLGQSTYNQEIRVQVAKQMGCSFDAVTTVWGKVRPSRAVTFNDLQRDLGACLWDGERDSGVIPMATGCLAHGYCHIVAVGDSERQARHAFETAEVALAH